MTEDLIDLIANDGCRNAVGGIYSTRVYEFANAIEAEATAPLLARIAELEAQIAAVAPAVDAQPAWISVDKRLPEQNEVVLITGWSRCRGEITDVRFQTIAMHMDGTFYNDESGDDYYPPTHWLAIPEAPSDAIRALSQKDPQ
jgi:hypothetical protein